MNRSNRPTGPLHRLKCAMLGILILLSAELLTACVPVMLGTGFITTVNVITDRRSINRVFNDNTLEIELRYQIKQKEEFTGANVSVTAINGIVLLTGEVPSDDMRQKIEQLADNHKKTVVVVNELQLSGTTSITSRANDTLITTKVKTNILNLEGVHHNAVKVVTEGGKVYLMGLVTRKEAEIVVEAARKTSGVTHIIKVFEYIEES